MPLDYLLSLSNLTNAQKRQMLDEHRVRHAWFSSVTNGKDLHNGDGSLITLDQISKEHEKIVEKLFDNEVNHYLVDGLDNSLSDVLKKKSMEKSFSQLPRDIMVVKDFISLIGPLPNDEETDTDLLVRSTFKKGSFNIQTGNVILPIRKVLDPDGKDNINYIYDPQSLHDNIIPLYDLILKKKNPSKPVIVKDLVKLDLGCGENKAEGYIGIDRQFFEGVDLVWDLSMGIPYPDNSVSELRAIHFLEHMWSPDYIMREIHRVLVDGGLFHFEVPSTKGEGSFANPDHRSYWNKSSFMFWSVPELLGGRPRFNIEVLHESDISDAVINVTGVLSAIKDVIIAKDMALTPVNTSFIPYKPLTSCIIDSDSYKDIKVFPAYIEPKYTGYRAILEKNDNVIRAWFADNRQVNCVDSLDLKESLQKIEGNFILDCIIGIKHESKWLSKEDIETITTNKPVLLENDKISVIILDAAYLGKDIHKMPFSERKTQIEAFFNKNLAQNSAFELSKSIKCLTKEDFFDGIPKLCALDGSSGAILKAVDGEYSLSGISNTQKTINNAIILQKSRYSSIMCMECENSPRFEFILNEKDIHTWFCVDHAKSFVKNYKDIITSIKEVDGKASVSFSDNKNVVLTLSDVLNKEDVNSSNTQDQAASTFWAGHWFESFPKSGKGAFVYQHHWRGLTEDETKLGEDELLDTTHSVHGDLRLEIDDKDLSGWSIFLGKASDVKAGKDLISIGERDLQATPKPIEQHGWLGLAHGHPFLIKPGSLGSTSNAWAKLFEEDFGTFEIGVWREHMFELFLHGNKLKGRVLIQFVPLGGKRVWLVLMPTDQTPYAQSHKKEDVLAELRSKGQPYLVWAEPGKTPELLSVAVKVAFFKEDKSKHIVYGVVYEPDVVDLQGDWATAEDIEDAAHKYLAEFRETKLSHRMPLNADVVESYIAPLTFFSESGERIRKGSWIMAMKIKDDEVWKDIEAGIIVGFSMGGLKQYV